MKKFWKVVGVILLFVGIAYFGAEMEKREKYGLLGDEEVLEDVANGPYAQYADHVFFRPRGGGDCDSLTGDVLVTVIFVDENGASWSESEKTSFRQELESGVPLLTTEASRYGIGLNLSFQYLHGTASVAYDRANHLPWATDVLSSVGISGGENAIAELKYTHEVQEAPIVFAKKEEGRSFATSHSAARGLEYVILYHAPEAFCHELLHLYGAKDFYYPDEVKEMATTCFPGSFMNAESQNKVDPLTAYLVGWTDVLDPSATRFLDGTKHYTTASISSAHKTETKTGFGVEEDDRYQYFGYLKDGMFHGSGTYIWKESGAVLKGTFENGKPVRGTMTYADGARYEGTFLDWKPHGTGTMTYPDGDRYEGEFQNSKRHGSGTHTWKEGNYLKGTFEDGKPVRGTKTWTDGARYEGEFLDWQIHGIGTLTYPNGKVRTGRWANGKFVG